jgi:minor histocompatibility antigen H13
MAAEIAGNQLQSLIMAEVGNGTVSADVDETGFFVAYGALFTMAIVPIYVGSYISARKTSHEAMTSKEAAMFPVYASGTLFGLYLLFKVRARSFQFKWCCTSH